MKEEASNDEIERFFTLIGGKVWNENALRIELLGMRGGCQCCISPPCNACVDPITMEEAERLGFHMEDFSKATDRTEAAPVYCLREACETWVHPDPYPHHPVLVERHGMLVCPKCKTGYGPAPDDGHDPMHAVRDFCK